MAIRVTQAKKGMVIRYEGDLYQITKYDHVTPGNWRAIHHIYLKHLKTGKQKELRMNTSDQIELVFLDTRDCQFLYHDSHGRNFMDTKTYDQFAVREDVVGEAASYITEETPVKIVFCEGEAIAIELPPVVVLEVVEAEDAARGDTVSNVQKPAKLVTGLEIKVPPHIKVGEKIRVSTDTGEFQGRAN